MNKNFSPATIISIVGGVLAVIGLISYFSNAANLSVPTFFYGVPILLIGLALKSSELSPAKCKNSSSEFKALKEKLPKEIQDLVNDVTRFRYGQRVHLESSLQVLKLWNEAKPPQLQEIELLERGNGYGIQMKFKFNGVPITKWEDKKDRLGRFFAKNLNANITSDTSGEIELTLLPKETLTENSSQASIQ
ncbi:DUF2854 domain-containing protein [Prochlorococcus marinus]|uniref:DUF2854 domain-containing protein n=1 Tax=Prochlorococcus marinus (strain MIT 9211) TaxID=93059 RepID=A9BEC1_PROM4|nr:DUF2854 domain-containing protein [Prochlorococcus marinus]ABX08431.1 conserved hypothetical protein [Prochlorococcus marinus str. MIT 9211]